MNMLQKLLIITGLIFLIMNILGCMLAAAGAGAEAGYVVTQENKSTAEVIDDQLIVTSIKTQFLASSEVSGLNLNVDSNKAIVTLRGFARSERELERAIEIARGVSGVRQVVNKVTIQH